MTSRDPLGYYATMKLDPSASDAEIGRAFRLYKLAHHGGACPDDYAKVCDAYTVLSDPAQRASYDGTGTSRAGGFRNWNWVNYAGLASVAMFLVLAVQAGLLNPTNVRSMFNHFEPGDSLQRTESGTPLGTIVAYEKDHEFPRGIVMAAYRVRPATGEEERWYPAHDLERHFETN